jgi:hypothetical protein
MSARVSSGVFCGMFSECPPGCLLGCRDVLYGCSLECPPGRTPSSFCRIQYVYSILYSIYRKLDSLLLSFTAPPLYNKCLKWSILAIGSYYTKHNLHIGTVIGRGKMTPILIQHLLKVVTSTAIS